MPTYDYECIHCGKVFEVFQKISDKPLEKCPKCNKKIRRLIGKGAGIIFKGSGFYATDYKKKPKTGLGDSHKSCPNANPGCSSCPSARQTNA